MSTAVGTNGLKRICRECSVRFYDFNKRPIICPACNVEFVGEVKSKGRKSRAVANDEATAQVSKKPVREKPESAAIDDEDDTETDIVDSDDDDDIVSLEEVEDLENDDDDLDDDDEFDVELVIEDDIDLDEEDLDDLDDISLDEDEDEDEKAAPDDKKKR